jgi:hypothetical protein
MGELAAKLNGVLAAEIRDFIRAPVKGVRPIEIGRARPGAQLVGKASRLDGEVRFYLMGTSQLALTKCFVGFGCPLTQ